MAKKKANKNGQKKTARNPRGSGRPRFKFDIGEVEKLAGLGCTNEEIAWWFGCHPATVYRQMEMDSFRDAVAKGKHNRRASLRRMQWVTAKDGNVAMQIFLGKNELGQSDRQDFRHSGKVEAEVQVFKIGNQEIEFK